MVLTCLRLETRSNFHYFWSFIIQSLSSSNFFFGGPGSPLFSSKPGDKDILFISVIHLRGVLLKRSNFFIDETKKIGFNLSTLRNTFQHLILLKLHHALIIFIKFLFAALVQLYSVLLWGGKIFCSSEWFIYGGVFGKKFFIRWDQKSGLYLSTLRNSFQHLLLLEFHHALNIFIKIPFAALVQLYSVLP